jgi:predicted permease
MILTAITVVLRVFVVLALGYFAGRARKFDPDQVAGLNELVLDYALPAMLFVATFKTPREGLLSEGSYALALLIATVGVFLVVVLVSTRVLHHSLGEATLQANLASFPSVAFFWPAYFSRLIRRIQSSLDSVSGDLIRGDNYSAYRCAARDTSPAHERWCRTRVALHDYSEFS